MPAKYIIELLQEHDCVIVPQFGAFLTRSLPAKIDEEKQVIEPPKKEILFNENLTADDALLASYIANREQISQSKAENLIQETVEEWSASLLSEGELTIEYLGLFKKENDLIIFEPENQYLVSNTYGLGETALDKPKEESTPAAEEEKTESEDKEETTETAASSTEEETTAEKEEVAAENAAAEEEAAPEEDEDEDTEEEEESKSKAPLIIGLIVLLLLIGGGATWYFLNQDTDEQAVAELHEEQEEDDEEVVIEYEDPTEENQTASDTLKEEEESETEEDGEEGTETEQEQLAEAGSDESDDESSVSGESLGMEELYARKDAEEEAKSKKPDSGSRFYIIGGYFSTEKNAQKFIAEINKLGYNGVLLDMDDGGFRVSYEEALPPQEALDKVDEIRKNHNSSAWLFQKK